MINRSLIHLPVLSITLLTAQFIAAIKPKFTRPILVRNMFRTGLAHSATEKTTMRDIAALVGNNKIVDIQRTGPTCGAPSSLGCSQLAGSRHRSWSILNFDHAASVEVSQFANAANSGQISCQSAGRISCLVTAPSSSFSIFTHRAGDIGASPEASCDKYDGEIPSALARRAAPPRSSDSR
nr:MAG TPA: hypothetical protein [Caudoviricetes sp.]